MIKKVKDIELLKSSRLLYLDNLRSFVIILVVAIHASVTYTKTGSWYYKETLNENSYILGTVLLGIFQSFTQAWFMGTLFFISAFFAVKSRNKRNVLAYIKERLFRLGVPLLLYILVIEPFIAFILLRQETITWQFISSNYKKYIISFSWIEKCFDSPLWFVTELLLFSVIYAIIRCFYTPKEKSTIVSIKDKYILFSIFLAFIIFFAIRQVISYSYFQFYISILIFGIIVGEENIFYCISDEKNIKWFIITLFMGIPLWIFIIISGGALKGEVLFQGGISWKSVAYTLWESFVAIGFSIGIIAFFKKYINIENIFTKLMAENSFGIYIFHSPILIAITLLLKTWKVNPLIKFSITTIVALIVSLLFVNTIRKVKLIKKIL